MYYYFDIIGINIIINIYIVLSVFKLWNHVLKAHVMTKIKAFSIPKISVELCKSFIKFTFDMVQHISKQCMNC